MASLSMKFLSGLGVEEDKAELICQTHREVLTEIKDERDRLKEEAEKIPGLQKQVKELEELAAHSEKDPYKVKYEAIKEEFEEYKKGIEQKETTAKKEAAYKDLLKKAGVSEKRIPAILKVTDVEGLEFDKQGDVKDADKLTESIKEEWADFIAVQTEKGAKVANPPASNTGKPVLSRKEIMEIEDTTERQKAWAEFLENERKK